VSATPDRPPAPASPWPGEAGAERLRDAVLAACARRKDFPGQLEAALRAALELLAADPDLAHLLTVRPYLDDGEAALRAQRRWLHRFGELLRNAAPACPEADSRPRFLEPFLIGGIRFQIAGQVLDGEAEQLQRLLSSALEFLLSFYLESGEVRRIVREAAAGGGETNG
jgi:hypothetical protein